MIVLKLSPKKKPKNPHKNKELFNKHPTIDHFATLYASGVKVRRELKQNSSTCCHGLLECYNVLPSLDLFFQLHVFKNQIFATFEKKRIRNVSNGCVFISS
jgi:hypothetical protein